jgi:hypothetical protein
LARVPTGAVRDNDRALLEQRATGATMCDIDPGAGERERQIDRQTTHASGQEGE